MLLQGRWCGGASRNAVPRSDQLLLRHYFHWGQTPEALREQIEGFFGEQHRSPSARPTDEVLLRSEVYRESIPDDCKAVVGFFVPLANGLGIWTTFLVRKQEDSPFFEFEIFHL